MAPNLSHIHGRHNNDIYCKHILSYQQIQILTRLEIRQLSNNIFHSQILNKIIMFTIKDRSPSVPSLGAISESILFQRRADSKEHLYDIEDLDYDNVTESFVKSQNQKHHAG